MTTINVTVNTEEGDNHYEVLALEPNEMAREIHGIVEAAMKLHMLDWTSMVITFSNPQVLKGAPV